jgi:hypothetical protein
MREVHPRIRQLIDDEFEGDPQSDETTYDRAWLSKTAQEAYVDSVSQALQLLGQASLQPDIDTVCAEVGFLRGFHTLTRAKLGKSWRQARKLNS